MLAETLENQFSFMTKITSHTFSHGFIWDNTKKELVVNPSVYFQVTRWILTVWSVWSLFHEMYWALYALKHGDQSKFDDLVDILYVGGGLVAVSLHVAYHFVDNEIVSFVNRMNKLNSNFEGYYKLIYKGTLAGKIEKQILKTYLTGEFLDLGSIKRQRKQRSLTWLIYQVGALMAFCHSLLAVSFYFRYPEHRRYTYNVVLGTMDFQSWPTFPLTLVTFGRLMHRWGSSLFYGFLQTAYCEVSTFWLEKFRSVRVYIRST